MSSSSTRRVISTGVAGESRRGAASLADGTAEARRSDVLSERTLDFGPFQLFRAQRVLVESGRRVRLGSRALDILLVLAARPGVLVAKRELLSLIWPHSFVDEGNLRVHIGALRKVLGEAPGGSPYITNVSGRGYLLDAPATLSDVEVRLPSQPEQGLQQGSAQIIGREGALEAIIEHLGEARLVTILGPAGVGKSAVALAVAERMIARFEDGIRFVELSSVSTPEHAIKALATSLAVSVPADRPIGKLVQFLKPQQTLIVLDNCEHLLDAVAPIIEDVLKFCPGVRFLTTSREAILLHSEIVHRLPTLEFPARSVGLTAPKALAYPAVQLFVTRARASSDVFVFRDLDAPAVADICSQLDGLPLAIELVAARVDLFGARALVGQLDEKMMMLARRSRNVLPRQQSIRGALDWSYDLLSAAESAVLRRFSVFRRTFSLDSALKLASGGDVLIEDVLSAVASLTAKSLVSTEAVGAAIRYRLLYVTRSYAHEKLVESGEAHNLARAHGQHHRDLLAAAEIHWETMDRAEWLAEYGAMIDDVRAALDWAFSDRGDIEIGTALTIASLPFGFQMSLIDEFRRRAELALEALATLPVPDPVRELRLLSTLQHLDLTGSVDCAATEALFARSRRVSDNVASARHKIESMSAQAIFAVEQGRLADATDVIERLSASARETDDGLAILLADRVAAQIYNFTGEHDKARILAERVLRHPAPAIPLAYAQTGANRRVSMRIVLARILWLQGRADQAIQLTDEYVEMAQEDGPFSICFSLALGAGPLALWTGDLDKAEAISVDLIDHASRFAQPRFGRLGAAYNAIVKRRRLSAKGPFAALDVPFVAPVSQMQTEILATIDDQVWNDALFARAQHHLCGWCNPEILRASGEFVLNAHGMVARGEAERTFKAAIANAHAQGALAWELRAATSLADLMERQSRVPEAMDLLGNVLGRISEGHGTADVQRASAMMDHLLQA